MMGKDYVPLPMSRVAELLEVSAADRDGFREAVDLLRMAGVVVVMKKERLCLAKGVGELCFGKVHFHSGHAPALFFPEVPTGEPRADALKIGPGDSITSLHGDRVLARILPRRDASEPRYASVLYVIERSRTKFVGTLRRSGKFWTVVADDPRIRAEFLVPYPAETKREPCPKPSDYVMVELARWDNPRMNPEAALLASFDKARTPDAEYKSLLASYGLNPEFAAPMVRVAQATIQCSNSRA